MFLKFLKLVLLIFISYQTPLYSKSATFNEYNSRDLTNEPYLGELQVELFVVPPIVLLPVLMVILRLYGPESLAIAYTLRESDLVVLLDTAIMF